MQKILKLLFILTLTSCSALKSNDDFVKSDYEIAEKSLQYFYRFDNYRLIATPDNEMTNHYLNGFMLDTLDLRDYKFSFKSNPDTKWERKHFTDTNVVSKLSVIDDYSKIEMVSYKDFENGKIFIKLSRPLYSSDNKYAVIRLQTFFNVEYSTLLKGYTLIFTKKDDEWVLINRVLTSIS